MDTSGFMGGFYRFMEWIMRLAILNILWISFSLLGLVIFGLFPATVAMFAVVRKWMLGEDEISIFKTFWTSYKEEFVRSHLLGLIVSSTGVVLYIDFLFIHNTSNGFVSFLYIPFSIITFIFVCMLFYIIPIFVHYDMKISKVIKNSFFVMLMNPLSTFYMLVGSFGLCFALTFAPPLSILFSGNLVALLIMRPACNAFNKIYQKSQLLLQEQ